MAYKTGLVTFKILDQGGHVDVRAGAPSSLEDCVMPFGAFVMTSDQKQKEIEARDSGNDEAVAFVPDGFPASTEALGSFQPPVGPW